MIQAITNQQVGLNVITELIIGYALPGRPVAMMMFKVSIRKLLFKAYASPHPSLQDMGLHHHGTSPFIYV